MKLKYVGMYDGIEPRTGRPCRRNETYDFPDDVAKELLLSGQFERVEAEKPSGGE